MASITCFFWKNVTNEPENSLRISPTVFFSAFPPTALSEAGTGRINACHNDTKPKNAAQPATVNFHAYATSPVFSVR